MFRNISIKTPECLILRRGFDFGDIVGINNTAVKTAFIIQFFEYAKNDFKQQSNLTGFLCTPLPTKRHNPHVQLRYTLPTNSTRPPWHVPITHWNAPSIKQREKRMTPYSIAFVLKSGDLCRKVSHSQNLSMCQLSINWSSGLDASSRFFVFVLRSFIWSFFILFL